MILKTCPELLDRTGQTVQTSGMEKKCSLWDMHTAVHTLLLHKDYWAGKQARRSLGAAKRKPCTSPGEMPLSPRRVPKSRTELRVALRQWAGVLPGAAQTDRGCAWMRTGSPDCSQAHFDAGLGQAVNDTVHHVLSLNDLGQRTQVSAQLNSIHGLLGFWLQHFECYI